MHFRFSLATVALMGIASASAHAQAPAAAAPQGPRGGPTSVALVDVGYIIKNHPTMNAEMDKIKEEMTAAQDQIEQQRKALLSESEVVGKFDTNSPEFKQKQEQLLNKESKLRVDFMGKEKEFAEKQASVVFSSYQDISESIKYVADHYKIDIVLRYSREQNEMDPKKPNTVNFGIQKDVLYQAPGMDLTDIVLTVVKGKVQSKGTPVAAPRVGAGTTPGRTTR